MPPGYTPAPLGPAIAISKTDTASVNWVRLIVDVVNRMLSGKLNAVLPITLANNATTTTIIDARITAFSGLILCPLTADAASITAWVSSQQSGQCTFTHQSAAEADLNFNLVIIG